MSCFYVMYSQLLNMCFYLHITSCDNINAPLITDPLLVCIDAFIMVLSPLKTKTS